MTDVILYLDGIPLKAVDNGDGTYNLGVGARDSAPIAANIVAGALNGSGAQSVTDITGADVTANKTFVGNVLISAAAQNAVAAATGSVIATITWLPGTGGTTARRVATVNLELPAGGAALNGVGDNGSISVPVTVYAGTTAGKFQVTVTVAGTITAVIWDACVNGVAQ